LFFIKLRPVDYQFWRSCAQVRRGESAGAAAPISALDSAKSGNINYTSTQKRWYRSTFTLGLSQAPPRQNAALAATLPDQAYR
jgi:hypothetical protein